MNQTSLVACTRITTNYAVQLLILYLLTVFIGFS